MRSAAAASGPVIDARLVRRVCAFLAVSIAAHALLLVGYAPGGGGAGVASEGAPSRALSAVLAPAPSESPPAEAAPADPATSAAEASPPPAAGAQEPQPGLDIPRPDKWYSGAELTALAEPQLAPRLVYPRQLEGSGLSARVRIRLFVDERGLIRRSELVQPGPHAAFDEAALKAWEGVTFKPAQKDGSAVKSQKLLELEFTPG